MAAFIQKLKDKMGNIVYPKTKNDAVYNSKGVPLSEQHFVIEGPMEFNTTEYIISDDRIRSYSLVHIYYNDNYDIMPLYDVKKGSITITMETFPEDLEKVIIDVVEVVNL